MVNEQKLLSSSYSSVESGTHIRAIPAHA